MLSRHMEDDLSGLEQNGIIHTHHNTHRHIPELILRAVALQSLHFHHSLLNQSGQEKE